jgi:RNA polymerase primary sigma factor
MRMYRYHAAIIAGFAAQLRRGPNRVKLRQLAGIEYALSVVEAGRQYPFDFIRHAIIGLRAVGDAALEGQLVDGSEAREDLITLAEELSASAEVSAAHWPEPLLSVTDLAKRFDVSTKTIFRWHRRGMVGWRVRYDDRRVRLVFPDRCVRRFVAANLDLVSRGASFSQLSPAERDGIVNRALHLVGEGNRTVNAVAKVIAAETNRAVETIRLILKHYDEAHPQRGVFNRSSLSVEADDVRMRVWEAHSEGQSAAQIAERYDRPLAWVRAVIVEMRARDLKSREIEYVPSPDFVQPDADAWIPNYPAAVQPYGEPTSVRRIPADLPPYLRNLFSIPLLTPEGEVALFRKLNYLRWKADEARKRLDPTTATQAEVDGLESLLWQAEQVKKQIVESNLRLVVSIAKKHMNRGRDFFEIVSDGNMSLMRAVDKFDFTRGFKFSTYASWAIMKNFARALPEQAQHRDRYQTGRDEMIAASAGPLPDEHETEFLPELRARLEHMLSALDERERAILRQRYGLDGAGEPATLEQIGLRFGVSKERIRQLEARAMDKLRTDFEGQAAALFGS